MAGPLDTMQASPDLLQQLPKAPASPWDDHSPSFGETIAYSYQAAKDVVPFVQTTRMDAAYGDLTRKVAKAAGKPLGAYDSLDAAFAALNPFGSSRSTIDRDAVWKEVDALKARGITMPDLPATRGEFERGILTRGGEHQADQVIADKGNWAAGVIGGAAAGFWDPVMMATGAATGGWSAGAKTMAGSLLRSGLVNAGIFAVETPLVAQAHENVGEEFTLGSAVEGAGSAFLFGMGLHAAGTALGKAGSYALKQMPKGIELARAFVSAVRPEDRTPDQQAALHVIEAAHHAESSNPFSNTQEALDAHQAKLGEAINSLQRGETPGTGPAFNRPAPAPSSPLTPSSIISFVQHDLEGGDKLVNYSSADGGQTKYGIAAVANPGIDVANLSAEDAAGIARRRYWFKELDSAPPELQAVAFDAGYASGPEYGRRLLREAGGDWRKAISLYREHLTRIADTVKGKAKYRQGWINRVDKLEHWIERQGDASGYTGPDVELTGRSPDLDAERPYLPEGEEYEPSAAHDASAPEPMGAEPAGFDPSAPPLHVQELLPVMRAVVADRGRNLNDIAGMASDLGVDETVIRQALLTLTHGREISQRQDGRFQRRPRPQQSGPEDVLTFLARAGGLRDDEGHDLGLRSLSPEKKSEMISPEAIKRAEAKKSGGRGWQKFIPGVGPLLRHAGMSIDDAGELLAEAGYLRGREGERPTTREVLDYLEARFADGQPRFTMEDMSAGTARESQAEPMPEDWSMDPAPDVVPNSLTEEQRALDLWHRLPDYMQRKIAGMLKETGLEPEDVDPWIIQRAMDLHDEMDALDPTQFEPAFWQAVDEYASKNAADAFRMTDDPGYDEAGYDHIFEGPEPAREDRGAEEDLWRQAAAAAAEAEGGTRGEIDDSPWEPEAEGLGFDPATFDADAAARFDDPNGSGMADLADAAWHDAIAAVDDDQQFLALVEGASGNEIVDQAIERAKNRARAAIQGGEATKGVIPVVEMRKLFKKLQDGAIDLEQFELGMSRVWEQLEQRTAKRNMNVKDRERGGDFVRERLLQAKRRGDISADTAEFAEWFILQNPALLDDLGISVRQQGAAEGAAAGAYNPAAQLMTLFKGADATGTAVHEITHHLERMMPEEHQAAIRREWQRGIERLMQGTPEQRAYAEAILEATARPNAENVAKATKLMPTRADYQYLNPSEFWAENATRLLSDRYAVRDSVWGRVKNWMREAMQHIRGALGLQSDAPVLKAMNRLIEHGETSVGTGKMLAEGVRYFSEGEQSFEDARAELESDQEALQTIRSCMLPPMGGAA